MRLSLSTNWCNRRIDDGRAIADKALELGFEELELGFHTNIRQVEGFRARLGQIPVGSVHAFCPVPLSAPQGDFTKVTFNVFSAISLSSIYPVLKL